jgi:WD40 repeat protein
MTSVFLSYTRGDDGEPFDPATSFAARLHHDLTAAGLDVWFDRVDMPSRNLTFHQEIRDAIAARERLVLIVGPKAAASEYVRQEWQFAWREADTVVTPILRWGDFGLVPDELKLLHCEDFRDDARYAFHLENLIRQLQEPPPRLGKLIAVPSLPAHYLARTDRLNVLRDALRADLDRPVVIGGAAARVGVHGMGGLGKSMLASGLARDRTIRQAFPDGVVWVGLGSLPDVLALQRRVHKDLGGDGAIETEHQGKTRLKELLADKALLLVLDDVWRRSDVDGFDVLGARGRALITTRDSGLLAALGGVHHVVELLSEHEAQGVLALAAGVAREELPDEAHAVVAECGRLPLAVALCGGMVHEGTPWRDVLESLREHDLEFIADDYRAEDQHRNLWKTMEVSVRALADEDQRRFAELSVFPNDEPVPEAAVLTLWAHTGSLSGRRARQLLVKLRQRSLIQLDRGVAVSTDRVGAVSLHDLLFDFSTRLSNQIMGGEEERHGQIVDAYARQSPAGWPSGPNDGYFFTHLFHHLAEAGRGAGRTALLRDLAWLEAKAEAGHVFDLAMDFTRTLEPMPLEHPARRNLRLIEQALRSELNFLARHPTALFQCLWNRCWWYDSPEAAAHYDPPSSGWPPEGPPWSRPEADRLATLLESWRRAKEQRFPGFLWLRSLRPPPNPLGGAEIACLLGHEREINSVAFSPDGRRIASGSWDCTVRVWNAHSGAEIACLRGHEEQVASVAFSPDGRRIASGSNDKTVRVWDTHSGAEIACLRGHESAVASVSFSPDGRRITSGSSDKTVRIWDANRGAEINCLRGHRSSVRCVSFSPDGRCIASGSKDNTVRVWDANSEAEIVCLRGHEDGVMSVAFSPDGRRIASGASDNTVRVWDAHIGAELACLRGHQDRVTSVAFSPDGRRIASGSIDNTVRVWDAQGAAELACLRGHAEPVTSVSFSHDGRRIASGSWDKAVRVWDAHSAAEIGWLRGHGYAISSLAFSPDGRCIASGSIDTTVWLWDAHNGAEIACLRGHEGWVRSVSPSLDGRRIASGSNDKTVRVWDAHSGAELACLRGHEHIVNSVVFSHDGRRIASASWDKTVRVWEAQSGAELACLRGHKDAVRIVAFSNDGRRIASGSSDKTVRVWDAHSGAELACLRGHDSAVNSVAFSPDGRHIVSGSKDKTLRVWDGLSGECLELIPQSGDVAAIAAGAPAQPWRAVCRDLDTVIEPTTRGEAVAWYPARLSDITTHPDGRIWVGSIGNHLSIIRLEGGTKPEPTGAAVL